MLAKRSAHWVKRSAPAQKVLSRHKAVSEDYHALARVHGRSRMISREATEVPNQTETSPSMK